MKRAFPTFITQAGKDFLVYVPDLDLYTEGNSLTDAIEMARDAIGSVSYTHLETSLKENIFLE